MMWQSTLLFAFVVWHVVLGYTRYLSFDGTCDNVDTISIDDSDTYYLQWTGFEFTPSCSYTFSSGANNKICVEAQAFLISACTDKLWYYGGLLGNDLKRTYSCHDSSPEKFCGDDFHYVKIKLTTSSEMNTGGYFTLKVTAKKTIPVGIIIGSVFGGIIFLGILLNVIRLICRRHQIERELDENGERNPIVTSTVIHHPPPQNYRTTYPGCEQSNTTPYPYPSAVQYNPY